MGDRARSHPFAKSAKGCHELPRAPAAVGRGVCDRAYPKTTFPRPKQSNLQRLPMLRTVSRSLLFLIRSATSCISRCLKKINRQKSNVDTDSGQVKIGCHPHERLAARRAKLYLVFPRFWFTCIASNSIVRKYLEIDAKPISFCKFMRHCDRLFLSQIPLFVGFSGPIDMTRAT
jgi:hypothetical protein